MASGTVKEMLDRARTFHRMLSNYYAELSDEVDRARVKMVCDYMSRHETYMNDAVSKFEADADKGVLNTWLKYVPEQVMPAAFDPPALGPEATVTDVVRTALNLDEALLTFYGEMVDRAPTPEVRELFSELVENERNEDHNVTRDAIEMEDL